MSVRIIIAGSRNFNDFKYLNDTMWDMFWKGGWEPWPMEIVSGGARGADKLGERWAEEQHIPVKLFIPDWEGLGKGAGFSRNIEMAEYADVLLAFWDGESRGTKHMIDSALFRGVGTHVYFP
jgi:hypothetical protein